MKKLEN